MGGVSGVIHTNSSRVLLMACMIRAVARRLSRQRFGVRFSSISSVVYEQYGNPEEVLQCVETRRKAELLIRRSSRLWTEAAMQPKPDEIAFQMLAAPINPADINMIQGKKKKTPHTW